MCQQLRKVKARAHVQDSLNFQLRKLSDFFFFFLVHIRDFFILFFLCRTDCRL